ncbi:hypothetical protein [Streptomyces sp. NPDC005780]|uniref:hypothetical protein n=1 Tax=Streptomyces sp. NPDC005780 TaxID=3364730 RepID=UPI0036AC7269
MFGRNRSPEAVAAKAAQAQHNARFNNDSTDPGSAEYLDSHDRVVTTKKAAKAAKAARRNR